jgi:hypothetical protein
VAIRIHGQSQSHGALHKPNVVFCLLKLLVHLSNYAVFRFVVFGCHVDRVAVAVIDATRIEIVGLTLLLAVYHLQQLVIESRFNAATNGVLTFNSDLGVAVN